MIEITEMQKAAGETRHIKYSMNVSFIEGIELWMNIGGWFWLRGMCKRAVIDDANIIAGELDVCVVLCIDEKLCFEGMG